MVLRPLDLIIDSRYESYNWYILVAIIDKSSVTWELESQVNESYPKLFYYEIFKGENSLSEGEL